MKCFNCGNKLREGAVFCHKCGSNQEMGVEHCDFCGSDLPEGAVFCDKCGATVVKQPMNASEEVVASSNAVSNNNQQGIGNSNYQPVSEAAPEPKAKVDKFKIKKFKLKKIKLKKRTWIIAVCVALVISILAGALWYVQSRDDIVAVAAGSGHTVILRRDGTVDAIGNNEHGQCDVHDWKDIVQITVSGDNTYGLKKDGTVVMTGYQIYFETEIENWKDIKQIAASNLYVIGLKKDGTVAVAVAAAGYAGESLNRIKKWKNIDRLGNDYGITNDGKVMFPHLDEPMKLDDDTVEFISDGYHSFQLKENGKVKFEKCPNIYDGKCMMDICTSKELKSMEDVVYMSMEAFGVTFVTEDGSVECYGPRPYREKANKLENMEIISMGLNHIVGIDKDGKVVAVGDNTYGQCDVEKWNK